MNIQMLTGEYWYGGYVTEGMRQPYGQEADVQVDLRQNESPNQAMPLFLSTKGRYLWKKDGFAIHFNHGRMKCDDGVELKEAGTTLKEAYVSAMSSHFPFHPCRLDSLMFEQPVFNSWIELTFYQNQKAILDYADRILEHQYGPGVLMIDDGWSDYYGNWTFSGGKFPDAKGMLDQLHAKGFKIMLWLGPFVTPDTLTFRELEAKELLVKDASGETYIAHWWNGWSALLDMTKPETRAWLKEQLQLLMDLGVDGFKFDGGDSFHYPVGQTVSGDEHSRAWAAFGEDYALNEYRVTNGAGGYSLMQRQCDKQHSWGDLGLKALVPCGLLQGLTGHPYNSPDMIGGGEYMNFQNQDHLDEELFVRHSEIACLMPVMQFSASPWSVLSVAAQEKVRASVALRNKYQRELMEAVEHCKQTGEPINRYMAYEFPDQGLDAVVDQFMLGSDLLVAPIQEKGRTGRMVAIPKGTWSFEGQIMESAGESREIMVENGPIVLRREP